ncbi:DUF2971 domain-containing protein [Clostridium pasteurianum]|uniref:DUF2971 domain-containing protein n=1 Tax=Clostridium pasteurianum BC1 TaxID=86416 RepID=R4KCQ1_CLOPA|nr:DUF2971 domain-containing protein [Clostridium pasteurianum]AGK97395.1 Protein of unknown function (DUF2971) [Clostridium pasteurianum BC1]
MNENSTNNIIAVHKYLTFNQFVDIIELQRSYFTNVPLWDDTYEAASQYEIFNQIIPLKMANSFAKDENSMDQIKRMLKIQIKDMYAQSWTYDSKESDAMWRIYSPDKTGVRITTNVLKLKEQMKESLEKDIEDYEVSYDLKMNADKYKQKGTIAGYITSGRAILEGKRSEFVHENEYRFSFSLNIQEYIGSIKCEGEEPTFNEMYNFKREPVKYYKFPLNLISEVLLDPRAPKYFEETFNNYCENRKFKENNIVFKKSDLYGDPSEKLFK